MTIASMDIESLRAKYNDGASPVEIVNTIYDRIGSSVNPVWISLVGREQSIERAKYLTGQQRQPLPLYGIPFAVKDNIDVAGMPTTAGCPAFAYTPSISATVVSLLEDAGAILIGKTNMDQFATGLVGTRSPYGACASVFDEQYISGGSSSGSAVAVASGLVTFALGTDTAGSGRVPAAFNNIVGLKPTRGSISTKGVVPACKSLDCVSIFALTSRDAWSVFEVTQQYDEHDSYSRRDSQLYSSAPWLGSQFRFGIPNSEELKFFADELAQELYLKAQEALAKLGGLPVAFNYRPFADTATLLYSGPWVAERRAALGEFFDNHGSDINPTVRKIISGSDAHDAVATYKAQYRLEELRKAADAELDTFDIMLLPTTGTIYTKEQVGNDPIVLNSNLGYYTNFVNLLDLTAVAVPAGFRPNGLPFGVTIVGRKGTEKALLTIADRLHRSISETVGNNLRPITDTAIMESTECPPGCALLAVVGAHLSGQPLNHQLTSRGARLMKTTTTSNNYRLFALANTVPAKPGLSRTTDELGSAIELEVWTIPQTELGSFLVGVPAPLGIGTVELIDGTSVNGFICESFALDGAKDITEYGGWRNYVNASKTGESAVTA